MQSPSIFSAILACALGVNLCVPITIAGELGCRVTGITDGDTLSCFDTSRRKAEKIRLRGIDAPEKKQALGERARQNLSTLAFGKSATVKWSNRDRWGRIIGAVWVEPADCQGCGHTLDVGRAQLAAGMAWWYRAYAGDQPMEERRAYHFEETEARARHVGIWQNAGPTPPWDWRKQRRPSAKHDGSGLGKND